MGHSHAVEKYLIEATLVFPWLENSFPPSGGRDDLARLHLCTSCLLSFEYTALCFHLLWIPTLSLRPGSNGTSSRKPSSNALP